MTDLTETPALDVGPQPNLPLLRKILDHVDAHPDEWDQSGWVYTEAERVADEVAGPGCGTAYCIAGWAVEMTEGSVVSLDKGSGYARMPASGRLWGDAGQAILGLKDQERWLLFDGGNSRADVQTAAEFIADRCGEVL